MAESFNDIPLTTLDNRTTTLAELRNGQPVYLKFWASWCQPCLQQMPHFQGIQSTLGDKIQVIAVNVDINESLEAIARVQQQSQLTMPILRDSSGKLAKVFNLRGTPDHVLIAADGSIRFRGHNADKSLDDALAQLAAGDLSEPAEALEKNNEQLALDTTDGVVLFTSTWCDWYLEKSRPDTSTNCVNANQMISTLAERYPDIDWQTVVSRLWTNDEAVNDYRQKYQLELPISIDPSNASFIQHGVNSYPTLVRFKDGTEVGRAHRFDALDSVVAALKLPPKSAGLASVVKTQKADAMQTTD